MLELLLLSDRAAHIDHMHNQLKIHCWLLAVDTKRLHFFHEVYNVSKGFRAATSEQVDIHIDLKQRASAALPNDLYIQLQYSYRTQYYGRTGDRLRSKSTIFFVLFSYVPFF